MGSVNQLFKLAMSSTFQWALLGSLPEALSFFQMILFGGKMKYLLPEYGRVSHSAPKHPGGSLWKWPSRPPDSPAMFSFSSPLKSQLAALEQLKILFGCPLQAQTYKFSIWFSGLLMGQDNFLRVPLSLWGSWDRHGAGRPAGFHDFIGAYGVNRLRIHLTPHRQKFHNQYVPHSRYLLLSSGSKGYVFLFLIRTRSSPFESLWQTLAVLK